MLRRIFGPERDEVKQDWRRLRYEELYDLYSSPSILIKNSEMGEACSIYGKKERCIQGLMGRPKGIDHLEKPGRRWEDIIKMDFREVA